MTFKILNRKYAIRAGSLAWWICIVATGGFIAIGGYSWTLLIYAIFY